MNIYVKAFKAKAPALFAEIQYALLRAEENMNCLNQIIVEGNLAKEPERKTLPTGAVMCTMPIAVNRRFKTQEGQYSEEVSFFDIDSYGNLAEACVKWCPKGRGVRVVGRLKQNRWKDESGKNHSKVKIVAEHIEFKPYLKKAGEMLSEASGSAAEKEPASADLGNPPPSKKKKLAMLAEAAAAAQHEAEAEIPVF